MPKREMRVHPRDVPTTRTVRQLNEEEELRQLGLLQVGATRSAIDAEGDEDGGNDGGGGPGGGGAPPPVSFFRIDDIANVLSQVESRNSKGTPLIGGDDSAASVHQREQFDSSLADSEPKVQFMSAPLPEIPRTGSSTPYTPTSQHDESMPSPSSQSSRQRRKLRSKRLTSSWLDTNVLHTMPPQQGVGGDEMAEGETPLNNSDPAPIFVADGTTILVHEGSPPLAAAQALSVLRFKANELFPVSSNRTP